MSTATGPDRSTRQPSPTLAFTGDNRRLAVFLDRDGVLVEERGLMVEPEEASLRPGVSEALFSLKDAGYCLIVVTNQAVVARGLATEDEVFAMNDRVRDLIIDAGGPLLDSWYICPHHPNATLPAYRLDCACRKPRPGMLLQAAADLGVDLSGSHLVGDRPSDIAAGHAAGCTTILVTGSATGEPPIESAEPWETQVPLHTCSSLGEAASWILGSR